ncbi:cellulose binding domain-containing protein [Streptomyces coerulescens]|uniref:Cellulose binding domain-containing protein n=1 Tax=Streptomyces coerulescens TaxID=29304 RepID=A0ABW0CYD4_STRCD
MSTRPDPAEPDEGPVLEPIHVLRPRRTDALAELFREWEESNAGYETVVLPGTEEATQELPAVAEKTGRARRRDAPSGSAGSGPGFRRTAVAVAVTAAAVVGFGGALLLAGRDDGSQAREPDPSGSASASAEPGPSASGGSAAPGSGGQGDPDCKASFRTVNSWQGGFQGEVTVTNAPASAASGWIATVVPPTGARLTQVWDGTLATTGDGRATVSNASWNGTLEPGASVTFGFLAATSDQVGEPSATVTCAATAGAS